MNLFRRTLLTLSAVALATSALVALGYTLENYRGSRRWAAVRRDLEARGESLDAARFIPAPVPDEQNLAMAPLFVRLYQYRVDPETGLLTFHRDGNTHAAQTVDVIPFGRDGAVSGGPGWAAARETDLAKFQTFYRTRQDFPHAAVPVTAAGEVLAALARFQPLVDELEQAATAHPLTRFPINWTQKPAARIFLPHNNMLQKLVSLLRLRACAALAEGHSEAALRDIRLGFGLATPQPTNPFSSVIWWL